MTVLRLIYTVWFATWAVAYGLFFGPGVFVWICCIANGVVLAGFWLERPELFSFAALSVLGAQLVWLADLLGKGLTGVHPLGITSYLLEASSPTFIRALSTFHGWMPVLLLFLVRRHGYSSRALPAVIGFAFCLFPFCAWLAASRPMNRESNFNWVRGLFDMPSYQGPWMSLWLALGGYLMVLVLPVHFALRAVATRREKGPIHGL